MEISLPYDTEQRLKSFLDSDQLSRERLCRSVLAIDKRFSEVRPRHPRGGPDGGRDIQAIFRGDQIAFGAVGFVNEANDSKEQKRQIKKKYKEDLKSALDADQTPSMFVFLTNVNLTIGEKEELTAKAHKAGITHGEIFDRERLRIELDSPDGFAIRFQYLDLSLSEAEQASFFARWGDDIQSVISTGFKSVEQQLNRVLFLQESSGLLKSLVFTLKLHEKYKSSEIGHFRAFCSIWFISPKQNISEIRIGSFDKPDRAKSQATSISAALVGGIQNGTATAQWERYLTDEKEGDEADDDDSRYTQVGSSTQAGREEVDSVSVWYDKNSLMEFPPALNLNDLDGAMFIFSMNKSLAEKVESIRVMSNGYNIKEILESDFEVDDTEFTHETLIDFTEDEMKDSWVRLRPKGGVSMFDFRFFETTPRRMFAPLPVEDGRKPNPD